MVVIQLMRIFADPRVVGLETQENEVVTLPNNWDSIETIRLRKGYGHERRGWSTLQEKASKVARR